MLELALHLLNEIFLDHLSVFLAASGFLLFYNARVSEHTHTIYASIYTHTYIFIYIIYTHMYRYMYTHIRIYTERHTYIWVYYIGV